MSKKSVEFIASQTHTRVKADGSIVEWHQENELAVTSKAEAIGMVQRTIDFWLPQLVTDLQQQRKYSLSAAEDVARRSFITNIEKMMDQPFAQRWGFTIADFTFEVDE